MKTPTATKLQDLVRLVDAEPLTESADGEISGCYIGDLLSDVLAHAQPGVLWITIQTHRNVMSVAGTKDIEVVLFPAGRRPAPEVVAEAEELGIVLLSTRLSGYAVAGKLWEAGIR